MPQHSTAPLSPCSESSAAIRPFRLSIFTATKNYNLQRDYVFEPRVFTELKNAQAIVLAYDGLNPLPPSYCYLKPYYLDPRISYFEHLRKGAL